MLIDQAVGSDLALANAYDRITPISIDRAVMESAAADHQVVMGAMDVGWSDLGSWSALLAALAGGDAGGAHGRVVQTGETITVGADDLVVRPVDGRLVVETGRRSRPRPAVRSSPTACGPTSPGRRHLADDVRGLLDRVGHQEVRA
jgi:hypothetical protein